jgi:hypothetical protein
MAVLSAIITEKQTEGLEFVSVYKISFCARSQNK